MGDSASTFLYDANGNQSRKTDCSVLMSATYDSSKRPTQIFTASGTDFSQYGPNGERAHMSGDSIEGGAVFPQDDRAGNPITDVDGARGSWTHRL